MKISLLILFIVLVGVVNTKTVAQVIFTDDIEDGKGNWGKTGDADLALIKDETIAHSGIKAMMLSVTGLNKTAVLKGKVDLTNGFSAKANYLVSAYIKATSSTDAEAKAGFMVYDAGGNVKYITGSEKAIGSGYKRYKWLLSGIREGYDDHYIPRLLFGPYLAEYYIDDIEVNKVNGFVNTGFEEEEDMFAMDINLTPDDGAAATISVVDNNAHSGNRAMQADITAIDGKTGSINVTTSARFFPEAGKTYEYSFYAKGTGPNDAINVDINMYDNNNGFLSLESNKVILTNEYQRYSVVFDATSSIYSVKGRIGLGDQVTTIYVDDLNITEVYRNPVANNDNFRTKKSVKLQGEVGTNDTQSIDGGNEYSLLSDVQYGTLELKSGGSFVYIPDSGFVGLDSFTYKLCDIDSDCDDATVSITVNENDNPVAVNDTYTALVDGIIKGKMTYNDKISADGANTLKIVWVPKHGVITYFSQNGTFIYRPNVGYIGKDAFTYKLCDADGDCDAASVTLRIKDRIPDAVDDQFLVEMDSALVGNVSINDSLSILDDENVWNLVTNPLHGTVVLENDGIFTYTPIEGFTGNDTFTYILCDIDGDCDTASVSISVSSPRPDYVPVALPDIVNIIQGSVINSTVAANDTLSADGGNTWFLLVDAINGTVEFESDGLFSYTPSIGFTGDDSFTYSLCDGDGDCDSAKVTVIVEELVPDDLPVTFPDSFAADKNQILNGSVAENDTLSDNGGNVFAITTNPSNGTVNMDAADGSFTYIPTTDFVGRDSFSYSLCDAQDDCSTAIVYISVKTLVGVMDRSENTLRCYPNPTDGILNIEGTEQGTKIEIVSITGTVVKSTIAYSTKVSIDVQEIAQGTYLLRSQENILRFIKK